MKELVRNWMVLGAMAGGLWMPGAVLAHEQREPAATEVQDAEKPPEGRVADGESTDCRWRRTAWCRERAFW